jgi:hypothetical protein
MPPSGRHARTRNILPQAGLSSVRYVHPGLLGPTRSGMSIPPGAGTGGPERPPCGDRAAAPQKGVPSRGATAGPGTPDFREETTCA